LGCRRSRLGSAGIVASMSAKMRDMLAGAPPLPEALRPATRACHVVRRPTRLAPRGLVGALLGSGMVGRQLLRQPAAATLARREPDPLISHAGPCSRAASRIILPARATQLEPILRPFPSYLHPRSTTTGWPPPGALVPNATTTDSAAVCDRNAAIRSNSYDVKSAALYDGNSAGNRYAVRSEMLPSRL
jgi:hypothetical protein